MEANIDKCDDATLVALVLSGEREAFGTLLLRYYPSVVRLCQRLLGPTLEAQDVAQEAALQAFLGLAELREPARFGAWLHAIAANLARMALRHRRILSLEALSDGAPLALLSAADAPTPEEVHAAREAHDAIVAALNELSAVNREAVIGFYLEGYSYVELAAVLGVPVSTIKGRLFKGRRQLQRVLAPLAHEVLQPDRRARKEPVMEPPELVAVTIEAIRKGLFGQHPVVVLRAQDTDHRLPIWIGAFEADAIKLALEGQQPQRPMTHDLALRLLVTLGAVVQRVVVNKLVENTFYAEITLAQDEQLYQVDARPSDALALAVRTGAPIYVARTVLDAAGVAATQDTPVDLSGLEAALAGQDPEQRLFLEETWAYLSGLVAKTPARIAREQQADLPDRFPVRETTWEGQPMLALQLPNPDDAAWLLVRPALWERIRALAQVLREVAQKAQGQPTCEPSGPARSDEPARTPGA